MAELQHLPGEGIQLAVILGVAAVELHLIDAAAILPVQSGFQKDRLGGVDPGMSQGQLPGLFGGDIASRVGVGGQNHILSGDAGNAPARVIVHLQPGGLTQGPDGGVGGAVIGEERYLLPLCVPGRESGAVDGDHNAVVDGDGPPGG